MIFVVNKVINEHRIPTFVLKKLSGQRGTI